MEPGEAKLFVPRGCGVSWWAGWFLSGLWCIAICMEQLANPTKQLNWLVRLRREKGLTTQDTARLMGISERHIWNIQGGAARLTDSVRWKIAKLFGLAPSALELLEGQNDPLSFRRPRKGRPQSEHSNTG